MIPITRAIVRLTGTRDHRGKPLVLQLVPGGQLVKIKVKGERKWYWVTIDQIWRQAAANRLAEIRAERLARRKLRKEGKRS